MKMEKDTAKARELYNSIIKSGLYDSKLGMYKVNDDLTNETKEIGRQNVFPRGWLENEAVFLHMEYKYFLGLLKCGLYDEFYECFKKGLVPFQDPAVYGRSILENSSFIASSVHPNETLHGTGFVSRLTGASAEMLNMWLYMTAGQKPFYQDGAKNLCLELKPALPGWLFTAKPQDVEIYRDMKTETLSMPEGAFAFNFLGRVLVVYHNEKRADTFGSPAACIKRMELYRENKLVHAVNGSVIEGPFANMVRDGLIDRIEAYME